MTNKKLSEILIFLGDGTGTRSELVIAICLLFHGIKLEDLCKLQISDVYDAHWEVRTKIRKLDVVISADLKAWLKDYLGFIDTSRVCYELERLLPSYRDPIRLAERLEDHGAIPEKVLTLGRQCYAEHHDNFVMPLTVENW